jgi:hypothetical protein
MPCEGVLMPQPISGIIIIDTSPGRLTGKMPEAILRVAELCAVKRAILHPPQFSVEQS